MPANNLALILDTETTGNKEEDELIEMGMVMLDVPSLNVLGDYSIVIEPSREAEERMLANPVVTAMHHENGLLADLDGDTAVPADLADALINNWLNQFCDPRTHIPWGGSGVLHFDRRYIRKQLPMLDKRLTYWAYDVGVPRRIFNMVGAPTESIEAKTHRALDDAYVHVEELRFYAAAGLRATKPPQGTKLVLMTDELFEDLGANGVEWGTPSRQGWYTPTVYKNYPVEVP